MSCSSFHVRLYFWEGARISCYVTPKGKVIIICDPPVMKYFSFALQSFLYLRMRSCSHSLLFVCFSSHLKNPPRLPEDKFSPAFVDFVSQWYVIEFQDHRVVRDVVLHYLATAAKFKLENSKGNSHV